MRWCFLFVFSLFVVFGCESIHARSSYREEPDLAPASSSKLADIPVPQDLTLLPKESYSFESGAVRVAVLKYHGRVTVDRVVRFYKAQMPLARWTLLNTIESQNCLLNFERAEETCIVDISPRMFGVLVTVSLGPKPSLVPKTPHSRSAAGADHAP